MKELKLDLVVTRHPGLVAYLQEIGLALEGVEVVAHATPENVAGEVAKFLDTEKCSPAYPISK